MFKNYYIINGQEEKWQYFTFWYPLAILPVDETSSHGLNI